MGLSLLTDEEIQLLQGALDKIRQERVNLPPRPPMERSFDEAEDHQAPETYIAKPQTSDGIPKLLEAGTGTGTGVSGSAFDEPGKADCDIYKIIVNETTGDPELHLIGLNLLVHNLSSADLDQDWLGVTRTKFGKWMAITSVAAVNGITIEWAKLDDTLSESGSTTATIWRGGPEVADLVNSGESVTIGAPPLMGEDTGTGTDVDTIASGSWVLIVQLNDNYWWVIGVPCP